MAARLGRGKFRPFILSPQLSIQLQPRRKRNQIRHGRNAEAKVSHRLFIDLPITRLVRLRDVGIDYDTGKRLISATAAELSEPGQSEFQP